MSCDRKRKKRNKIWLIFSMPDTVLWIAGKENFARTAQFT